MGADLAVDPAVDVGDTVDRFELRERVGQGGMGIVFLAHDPALARDVAVKVLRPDPSLHLDHARLLREAQALGQLRHPNVVAVHDVGTHLGFTYLAMDYIRGQTLRQWLSEQTRSPEEIAAVLVDAGRGIVAAHEAGLLHRDIKPGNLLIDEQGRAVVVDFGLARAADSPNPSGLSPSGTEMLLGSSVTDPQLLVGTPRYMAPELLEGKAASQASDQFAFAVTLFEAIRGFPPFPGRTRDELLAAMQETPPLPRRLVPAPVRRVLARSLQADPSARFASMQELVDALALAVGFRKRVRKRRWLAGGAVVVAAMAGVAYAAWDARPPSVAAASEVDRLAAEATAAAARGRFVYPPPDAPTQPTALTGILALEAVEGEAARTAQQRAQQLREDFAGTLTELGDRYWPIPEVRGFALDYYVQALVFDATAEPAAMRSGLTEGQRLSIAQRAERGEFSRSELVAAATLVALAEPDETQRAERLAAVAREHRAERGNMQRDDLSVLMQRWPTPDEEAPPPESSPPTPPPAPDVEPASVDSASAAPTTERPTPAPGQAKAAVAAGEAALERRDYRSAEQSFRRALAADPRSAAAMIGLADVFFERGSYARAMRYCKKAVALVPRNAGYHHKLGDAYFRLDRYRDAQGAYERAFELGDSAAGRQLERVRGYVDTP